MKNSSDIPEYAASAASRAKPTAAVVVVAGLVAVAVLIAGLGAIISSGSQSTVHPKAPAVQYEPYLCEPDGTFCEPTYLSPPPVHPVPGVGSGRLTSQREMPSG